MNESNRRASFGESHLATSKFLTSPAICVGSAPGSKREMRVMPDFPAMMFAHRSEEHTSELQSHSDLVCRLLLEKKKELSAARLGLPGPSPVEARQAVRITAGCVAHGASVLGRDDAVVFSSDFSAGARSHTMRGS